MAVLVFLLGSCVHNEQKVKISYPFEGSVFPAEFPSPGIRWNTDSVTQEWQIDISLNSKIITSNKVDRPIWFAQESVWDSIKTLANVNKITISVSALNGSAKAKTDSIHILISKDSVGAPIFFRSVILPFSHANKYKDSLRWYLGNTASNQEPKLMLTKLPVCANCHSFNANASRFAMDVDYANSKGSYTVSKIEGASAIKREDIFSWDDYKKDEKETTLGLLSQISPDGQWVLSTVKDRSIFVPVDNNFAYSQLFFPIKGILVAYNTQTKTYSPIKGADNPEYVQSSPGWSPDGKEIIFAKAKRNNDTSLNSQKGIFADPSVASDYVNGNKDFKFDLWRVPFNNGKGGEAKPIEGASNNGKSNYFPKFSPNGKWLVFCQSDNYMLLRKQSKLFIMPAKGGVPRKMNCNTNDMNSWHSWSPNGKWIIYATKHFGPYTQIFMTHIDENGNDSPPIWLEFFDLPKRAINIPEFVNVKYNEWNNISDAFSTAGNYFQRSIDESLNHNDTKTAMNYANLLIEKEPDNCNGYIQKARINLMIQKPEDAYKNFSKAKFLINKKLEKYPHSVELLKQKVEVLSRLGDFKNAFDAYKLVEKYNLNQDENVSLKINIFLDASQFKQAVDECNGYLAKNPKSIRIRSIRASLFMAIKDYEHALQDLSILLRAEPNNKDFLMKRLNINYILVRADDCLKDIAQIIKNGTNEYMVYFIAAQIYDARHDKAQALKYVKTALNIINSTAISNPTPAAEKEKVLYLYKAVSGQ